MASFQELEFAEMQVCLGEARAQRDEFRRRLQEETDSHKRTLSLHDDEVAEFNAGYEACKNGEPIEAEPSDLPFDVWQHGWKVADHERLLAEVADLRRQLEIAQAERDAARAEMSNARMLLGEPVGIDIAIMGLLTERYNLQVDNAKMRFYIVELERESRTIDMHLAQNAAREKYEAAFGEQVDNGRPIGVDRPGQPFCQLPEGHDGPHDR